MTGQVLGHYRILEQIGSGGMGDVYRARDERLGREVAVKFLKPSVSDNQDRLRRFEQEARSAAALNHPNIVAIFDIGSHEGAPYIVSELLEGTTLRQRLILGPLPLKQTIDFAQQIAQGLIAAHDKHIVHRDLKPENLFIIKDGRVKILDFGIAKLISNDTSDPAALVSMTTQTKVGSVLGTVAYMSPEQLRAKPVDHRTDLFSFGAILYEMLSGKRAFSGETEVDTMTAVLKEEPPEIDVSHHNIPPAFQQIVHHCLEKEPANRFQSARDLGFALGAVLDPFATKPVPAVRKRRILGAAWIPWTLAACLVALVAALLIYGANSAANPSYRRLSFERGTIYSARFTPDGRSVVYAASWNGKSVQLYSTLSDAPLVRPLDLGSAYLLGISKNNELALVQGAIHSSKLEIEHGTLARAPLAGGSPREVLANVLYADWDANGVMAVVHQAEGRTRLEYPIGKVLYESTGLISNVRFSPKGDRIAFIDHPSLYDDRGSIAVITLDGHKTVLGPEWTSISGVAWNPGDDEIWFTAAQGGSNRALWKVSLPGKLHRILTVPASMTLQDIASDGRFLTTVGSERLGMEFVGRADQMPVDLSWFDWTIAKDISQDGRWALFEESGEPAGSDYAVAIRRTDGSPPIRLGEGSAGGLSPNGKWALAIVPGPPQHVVMLPIGAGQPKEVSLPGIEHVENGLARFMPDGDHIVFYGNEAGHAARTYVADLAGGKPRPITPEGIPTVISSPDGKYLAGWPVKGNSLALYPVEDGTPREIPMPPGNYGLLQWSEDGSSIFLIAIEQSPIRVLQFDLNTGKMQVRRELSTTGRAGAVGVDPIVVSRDGSAILYSYFQSISDLYVISGLN